MESRARIATRELGIDKNPNGSPRVQLGSEEADKHTLDGVFVAVRYQKGRILYESVNLKADAAKHDNVWRDVLQKGEPASGTAGLSREAPDYVYAKPIGSGGAPLVLEAGKSYTSLE